jgi:8-oxo-dGTP diphosphatase
VCKRPMHKRHGGLWEFPGGKVEPQEDDFAAMRRELREELNVIAASVGREHFTIADEGSNFIIAFVPTIVSGEPQAREHDMLAWVRLDDLLNYDLAPSDRAYVEFRRGAR